MTGRLRRLSEEGIGRWRAWIQGGGIGQPPTGILEDPATSEPVEPAVDLDPPAFVDRHDLGAWLAEALRALDVADVRFDAGLWDWLSLLLVDEICPDKDGRRKVLGDLAKYSLHLDNHLKRARHLVRTPWWLVREHGEAARFCLATPLDQHGDLVEQLANRQEIVGSRPILQAAARLYWDAGRRRPKPGAATRKSPGSVRRLVALVGQLRLTYDLDSMSPEQILALLPREFDRFHPPLASPVRPGPIARQPGRGAPPPQGI